MNATTIFYNDEKWMAKDPAPFDARSDAQILPRGSVVAGFLKIDDANNIIELLAPPVTTEEQEKQFQKVLREARYFLYGSIYPMLTERDLQIMAEDRVG